MMKADVVTPLKQRRRIRHSTSLLLLFALTAFFQSTAAFGFVLKQRRTPLLGARKSTTSCSITSSSAAVGRLYVSSSSSTNSDFVAAAAANRGDARGAALLLENVSVYLGGSEPILTDINWRIEPRTKWALLGKNGCGKSTLLKAIVGEIPHSVDGTIVVGTKQNVAYLQQTAVAGSKQSIYDEAASGMTEINTAKRDMERCAVDSDSSSGDYYYSLTALERATARFEAAGGYQQEQKVAHVLKGLGFFVADAAAMHTTKCHELSGGMQMRVALARQLLSEPATISLLDEPSNHLDAAAKRWLANYLATYDGAASMILVTHDVELLQAMDHIAEVVTTTGAGGSSGRLQVYKSCNYNQYQALKEQRAAAAVAEYERHRQKAAKLQAFVDRFGASATKAKAAQSRVKQLEKMQREGLLLLDDPSSTSTTKVGVRSFRPTLVLPDPPRAVGHVLLSLQHADLGYNGGGKPLVTNVNLEIVKGMKLLIRGPNGSGKSTTLHSIRGTLPLLAGERKENPDLRLGMFTQDLAQELDPKARAVDLVTAYARAGSDGDIFVSDQDARGALGRLGLQGEKALRRICDLSGGEKARVALAMFSLKPSNTYFLDEPSNHLDIDCVEALSESLSKWGDETGAIVVVSHDRTFCEKIDFTHVATVQDGTFTLEQRSARASDWIINGLSVVEANKDGASPNDSATVDAMQTSTATEEVDPKQRKKAFNAPKRIAKLESLIEEAESKISELDEEMMAHGSDVGKLVDLTNEKEALESKVDSYMEEWSELEEILAQVEA